jgi:type IV pilus assembly protein PilM
MFARRKGLVGLDIGSSSIKEVELQPQNGGGAPYKLVSIGVEPVPAAGIVDGAIMDGGSVAEAIERLFSTQRVKSMNVATCVPGNATIVKRIRLPRMSPEELAESIYWEAEQYIPFDIREVAIDYEIVDGPRSEADMEVVLVATKKDTIADYTSVIVRAGRTPCIVDVDAFALQNCYEINYGLEPERVVALLNVGASVTSVNLVKNSASLYSRQIRLGGNTYSEAIQRDLSLTLERADALKMRGRDEDIPAEVLDSVLHGVSGALGAELNRTFEFFKATCSEDRVDGVFLSGGASRTQGLRELLEERLEASVEWLNPFNNVVCNPRDFDADLLDEIAPSAAIAVGLAARRVGDR